jgi:hypothetical protein
MACCTVGSVFQGVPEVRGIGRRTTALGRHGLPREHAPAGSEAEAWAACGGTRARLTGRRDVAARPRSGAGHFELGDFLHEFLLKFEYKCTK